MYAITVVQKNTFKINVLKKCLMLFVIDAIKKVITQGTVLEVLIQYVSLFLKEDFVIMEISVNFHMI